jgi:molybdate transport system substrate-binding protein
VLVRVALAVAAATMTVPVLAAEPVLLHAAGSLRSALTEVAGAYEAATGQKVQAKFGASGTLKNEIAAGARAEVFASANMEHPRALAGASKSGPVVLFARNRLCPSGDYAWEVFRKAEPSSPAPKLLWRRRPSN